MKLSLPQYIKNVSPSMSTQLPAYSRNCSPQDNLTDTMIG